MNFKLRMYMSELMFQFFFLISLSMASVSLTSCQKKKDNAHLDPNRMPPLKAYSEHVGASPRNLYDFSRSLWVLRKSDGTSSAECLGTLLDSEVSRNAFLDCLSRRGLSGLRKEFLEELVGVRMGRLKLVHETEPAKTLKLLNWIFDLTVEQYNLSNPKSYWLDKDSAGKWTFRNKREQNHDDYPFVEGDVILSISASELSTLIPQYTFAQRRLTHMMMYRVARGNQKEHYIESEFEEGVRIKFRDTYRIKDNPYENIVMRYNDPSRSAADILKIRHNAVENAAAELGRSYSFSGDTKDGFTCTLLAGVEYAHAILDFDHKVRGDDIRDLEDLFTHGISPLRVGLSRNYSTKFGIKPLQYDFPSAGDFLNAKGFEPVAYYIRPDLSKKFSDLYAIAEATVDSFDRGSEIVIGPDIIQKLEPAMKDRDMLKGIIGMVRKLKKHSLIREGIAQGNVSLELIDQLSVEEFKAILARLDAERSVLVDATESELHEFSTAFEDTSNVRLDKENEKKGIKDKTSLGAVEFFKSLKAKGAANFDSIDFDQLKLFMNTLDFDGIKDVVNYGEESGWRSKGTFANRLPVLGYLIKSIQDKGIKGAELTELTADLRTYSLFLLAAPALQKKTELFKDDPNTLENLLKLAPYLASELDDGTLVEFITYTKMASGVVEKFQEIRKKFEQEQLWQAPPWVQRSWMDYILSKVPVMRYIP